MIGPVFDAVASAASRVSLRSDACVRNNPVIAVREDCRACESACPAHAIHVDQLQVTTPPCDGCLLCLPSCPAVALVERPSARRDLLTAWRRVVAGESFAVSCGLAEPPEHDRTLEIGCLGSLRWEVVVVPMLLGASDVELRRGHCAECRLGERVGDTVEKTVGFGQRLCLTFALGHVDIVVAAAHARGGAATRDGPSPVARRLSRRELFSRVFRGGHDTAEALGKAVGSELAARLEGPRLEEASDDRLWLRKLVGELLGGRTAVESTIPTGPLTGRPRIDAGRCTRCGVCVAACPTGALTGTAIEAVENGIALKSAWCTGCGYCERACREDAVSFADAVDVREWGAEPITLVPPADATCRICGAPALGPMLRLCDGCYRRHPFETRHEAAPPRGAGVKDPFS